MFDPPPPPSVPARNISRKNNNFGSQWAAIKALTLI